MEISPKTDSNKKTTHFNMEIWNLDKKNIKVLRATLNLRCFSQAQLSPHRDGTMVSICCLREIPPSYLVAYHGITFTNCTLKTFESTIHETGILTYMNDDDFFWWKISRYFYSLPWMLMGQDGNVPFLFRKLWLRVWCERNIKKTHHEHLKDVYNKTVKYFDTYIWPYQYGVPFSFQKALFTLNVVPLTLNFTLIKTVCKSKQLMNMRWQNVAMGTICWI